MASEVSISMRDSRLEEAPRVPELVPIRYGRMLASPFGFFRGAALLMAGDLSRSPVTGLTVQVCGDAHLSNFGMFASPERRLVFDVNDFDETLPGPWEWDVKRLAASAEVAARENGFGRNRRREIVVAAVARYRREMRRLAGLGEVGAWQSPAEIDDLRKRYQAILDREERGLADADLARARDRAGLEAPDKLTRMAGGKPRFAASPPLLVPIAELPGGQAPAGLEAHLNAIAANYRRTLEWDRRFLISKYQVTDLARKVAGIGSVGRRRDRHIGQARPGRRRGRGKPRLAAQAMQLTAAGRAASRPGLIGPPHRSHLPYVPFSMRSSALPISASRRFAWSIRAATCCRSKAVDEPSGSCSSSAPAAEADDDTIASKSRRNAASLASVLARSPASRCAAARRDGEDPVTAVPAPRACR